MSVVKSKKGQKQCKTPISKFGITLPKSTPAISSCKTPETLTTLKEIIEALENIKLIKDKKHGEYQPPYYDTIIEKKNASKNKASLKFNGLQHFNMEFGYNKTKCCNCRNKRGGAKNTKEKENLIHTETQTDTEGKKEQKAGRKVARILPGTKLCPACSEALKKGQIPAGSLIDFYEH